MSTATKERKKVESMKVENEKTETVNGIDKALIGRYRETEKNEQREQENFNSLTAKLAESEKLLEESGRDLQACQSAEQSRDLTDIAAIEKCRNETFKASERVRDLQKVTQNLKLALTNSTNLLTRLSSDKDGITRKLFSIKRDLLLKEIEVKVGDIIADYLTCVMGASPGISPSGGLIPKSILEKLQPGAGLRERRESMLESILVHGK
ncbi:MAG: hypothetical protein MRK02_05630 [Candidatus Scalindua sp.]|nr:hypothetical protein [Candidatus Scalindua sp.]